MKLTTRCKLEACHYRNMERWQHEAEWKALERSNWASFKFLWGHRLESIWRIQRTLFKTHLKEPYRQSSKRGATRFYLERRYRKSG